MTMLSTSTSMTMISTWSVPEQYDGDMFTRTSLSLFLVIKSNDWFRHKQPAFATNGSWTTSCFCLVLCVLFVSKLFCLSFWQTEYSPEAQRQELDHLGGRRLEILVAAFGELMVQLHFPTVLGKPSRNYQINVIWMWYGRIYEVHFHFFYVVLNSWTSFDSLSYQSWLTLSCLQPSLPPLRQPWPSNSSPSDILQTVYKL